MRALTLALILPLIGCYQEVTLKVEDKEAKGLRHRADSLQEEVKRLTLDKELLKRLSETELKVMNKYSAEYGYISGQSDAMKKDIRIKKVEPGRYIFTTSPWDDSTKCLTCKDTFDLEQ